MDIKNIAEKITMPVAIIIAAVALSIGYFGVQYMKQGSIEKQQLIKLQDERMQQELENKQAALKLKQDECESLSAGVRQRWNNVIGVTYDADWWEECVVTYTDPETGEIEKSPLRLMQDIKR